MNKLLETILSTKRGHNSKGELAFLSWLHGYVKTLGYIPVPMAEGCTIVTIGGNKAKTLFSCHIDTVHSNAESDGSTQKLLFDESFQHVFLEEKTSTCLGADDGAGIYIMLKMIEAKVEGAYIFHRGEEKGGIGARAMTVKHKDWLEQFDCSIAFDRPGTNEVIITQGGSVCASPEFGLQLSKMLTEAGLPYENSVRGIFTDNRLYKQLIPCNVNLGVGYFNQHGNQEYLDWGHLNKLTEIACKLDWGSLKVFRKIEEEPKYSNYYDSAAWRGRDLYSREDYTILDAPKPRGKKKLGFSVVPKKPLKKSRVGLVSDYEALLKELRLSSYDSITAWCETEDPVEVANTIGRMVTDLDVAAAKIKRYECLLGFGL